MSSFKAVPTRRSKRLSKPTNIEIKQEPVVKEEPNDDGDVIAVRRPDVDGSYHANYNGSVNITHDFNEIKDEIKCEEEEADKKKDLVNSEVIKEEIKEEPKEEPNDNVDITSRPIVDGKYPAIYDKPFDVAHDFNKLKDGIKCEEEEADKKKDLINSEVIKAEIKEEPKEEPNDNVDIATRPRVDGKCPAIYDKPFDVAHDFNKFKDEIKCEEETVKEKEPVPFKRSDENKRSEKRATSVSQSSDSDETSNSLDDDSTEAAQAEKPPARITTRKELNKLRIPRHKLEQFMTLPFFDKLVTNCFVRVIIGNNNLNEPVYRCAEIVGVVETAKVYTLGKHVTNKGLRLRHGSSERVFRFEFVSDQDITDAEFNNWKEVCLNANIELPILKLVERKVEEMKEALAYELTDEDVQKIVDEKKRFRKQPTNYAREKTCLINERYAAVLRGQDDLARDLTLRIEELEEKATEIDKKRSSSISLITYINERNRKRNLEEAEKAIFEELKANKEMKIDDQFKRRSTKPSMNFKQRTTEEEATAMRTKQQQQQQHQCSSSTPSPNCFKSKQKEDDKKKQFGSTDDSLYSLHDFDIDLEVIMPTTSAPHPSQKPTVPATDAAPKRSIKLEDYKKKRGLI